LQASSRNGQGRWERRLQAFSEHDEAFRFCLIFCSRQLWWRWLTFERDQQQMTAPKNCWKPLESWNSLARYCSLDDIRMDQRRANWTSSIQVVLSLADCPNSFTIGWGFTER
jgi:hypothetical protein